MFVPLPWYSLDEGVLALWLHVVALVGDRFPVRAVQALCVCSNAPSGEQFFIEASKQFFIRSPGGTVRG